MGNGNVDLNDTGLKVEISTAETPEDADLRRWKEKIIFIVTLVVLGVVFATALFFVLTDKTPETQRYSWSALTAVISGVIGYKVK